MASRTFLTTLVPGGARTLRLLGAAALFLGAVSACGKVSTSDILGTGGADDNDYTLSITLPATSVPPGNQMDFSVTAKDKDGVLAKDGTVLTLSTDALGTVTPTSVSLTNGTAVAKYTAGTTEGSSTIKVKHNSTTQSATVKIDKSASTPPPINPNEGLDEFPYGTSNIQWDNKGTNMDVETWPITAEISSASHSGEQLTINNNCSDVWPHRQDPGWSKPSVGNYWIIGKINGQWHGATVDWVGVNRNGMSDLHLDGNAGMYSDLTNWRPVEGEEAYVMISTHAHAYVDTNNLQRTQIVRITIHH